MLQVVVIGAGQAGLTAAFWLRHQGLEPGREFVVLDRNEGAGGAWRHRWPALTLGRAHGIRDLPGLAMPRPDETVPASRVVSEYFANYEREFELPVERPVRVESVTSDGDGPDAPLVVRAGERTWRTRLVISAAGTWTRPFVPAVPGASEFRGRQLHTVEFWEASEFAGQQVVVVGAGQSAVQFVLMLEKAGASTVWSTRSEPNWLDEGFSCELGREFEARADADAMAAIAPRSVASYTGIPDREGYAAARARGTLVSHGPIRELDAHGVRFASGEYVRADAIIWATGFRAELGHLAPLRLREPGGGIEVRNGVEVVKDARVLLVGYGASASTVGATRAGRRAALTAVRRLRDLDGEFDNADAAPAGARTEAR